MVLKPQPDLLFEDELVPFEVEANGSSSVVANEVYLLQGERLVLYTENLRHSESTVQRIKGLAEASPSKVYLRKPAGPRKLGPAETLNHLANKLTVTLSDPFVSRQEKLLSVYSFTNDAVVQVFNDFPNPKTLGSGISYLKVPTQFLASDLTLIGELQALMSLDGDAYTHAASVFVYTIALAAWMGIHDETILRDIGLGAILHDIGKTKIDSSIEQKQGSLTEGEWAQMQRHPALGESMVARLPNVSTTVRRIIHEHHERCDGSGYPLGIMKNRIHPLTHLIVVADMFDALTKNRSYREAYSTFHALSIMRKQCGSALNADVYRALVCMLAGISPSENAC